jgi:hypothetical protein
MTPISRLLLAAASALALTALGCSGDGSTLGPDGTPLVENPGDDNVVDGADSTVSVTLAQLSADIFTPKCATAGCHGGANPAAGMSLTSSAIAASTIGVPSSQRPNLRRIDAGNPDGSYLIQKVNGTGAGSQMPLGGAPLSVAEIQLIVDWVTAGAQP